MIPSKEIFHVDKRLVKQIIHQAFNQRRKKLRTTLKSAPKRLNRLPNWFLERWKQAYQTLADDERMDLRPEDLDFDDWVELAIDIAKIEPDS